jgi:hypothetical protein
VNDWKGSRMVRTVPNGLIVATGILALAVTAAMFLWETHNPTGAIRIGGPWGRQDIQVDISWGMLGYKQTREWRGGPSDVERIQINSVRLWQSVGLAAVPWWLFGWLIWRQRNSRRLPSPTPLPVPPTAEQPRLP